MKSIVSIALVIICICIAFPVFIRLFWDYETACGTLEVSGCTREWMAALAGPLTIAAAIIAAVPVVQQLNESRLGTKAALATVIKYQEDDLGGQASALREEAQMVGKLVDDARTVLGKIRTLPASSPLGALEQEIRAVCQRLDHVAGDLSSKPDKDLILRSRQSVADRSRDLARDWRSCLNAKSFGPAPDVAFDRLVDAADIHWSEWIAIDGKLQKDRDVTAQTRRDTMQAISDALGPKPSKEKLWLRTSSEVRRFQCFGGRGDTDA